MGVVSSSIGLPMNDAFRTRCCSRQRSSCCASLLSLLLTSCWRAVSSADFSTLPFWTSCWRAAISAPSPAPLVARLPLAAPPTWFMVTRRSLDCPARPPRVSPHGFSPSLSLCTTPDRVPSLTLCTTPGRVPSRFRLDRHQGEAHTAERDRLLVDRLQVGQGREEVLALAGEG